MTAGLRLAVGLLTILPTGTVRYDPATARAAMVLAPLVGALLAAVLLVLGWAGTAAGLSPLLVAALAVSALALLTRGLHLDGLADTADGLGSARPARQALDVMRRSDIGPFGVLTLVLVLLVQVAAAADLVARGDGVPAVLAVVTGRLVLPIACHRGVPAARREGLGAAVAGTVPTAAAGAAVAVTIAGLAAVTVTTSGAVGGTTLVAAASLGLVGGLAFLRRCVRRFGGVTGDVLGACVEVAQTVHLVALVALAALAAPTTLH